jgi:hypothetical protein
MGEMWTQRHPARHVACLKRMVTSHALRDLAGWLEWADPPRSESATSTLSVVQAIAWHLRVGGGWRVFAAGHAALAHSLSLVPALGGTRPVRPHDARPDQAAPQGGGAQP